MSIFLRRQRPEIVVTIDRDTRRYIEHRRLIRIFTNMSREPTVTELERLAALFRKVQPQATLERSLLSMTGVVLTDENKEHIDLAGYGAVQPHGLHCQVARVTTMVPVRPPPPDAPPPPPPPPVDPDAPPADRADALLFVCEDQKVRAIDRVLLLNEGNQLMLDGYLCLRKLAPSAEERMRINSAHNVLDSDYLDYYTNADEEAARHGQDIVSDGHQQRYDSEYELVYMATDCLVVHSRQINKSYLQRITLVRDLTELPVAQQSTTGFGKRLQASDNLIKFSGGFERLQTTIFLRPHWHVKHARAFMHAVPHCLQGVAIRCVVFLPNDAAYLPGAFNDRQLEFSTRPTAWLYVDAQLTISASTNIEPYAARLAVHGDTLLVDTPLARRLTRDMNQLSRVLECEPVVVDQRVQWRPVGHCPMRKLADRLVDVERVRMLAFNEPLDEEAFLKWLVEKQAAATVNRE